MSVVLSSVAVCNLADITIRYPVEYRLVDFRSLYHKLRKLTSGDVQEEEKYLPLVKDFLQLSNLASIEIDTCLCACLFFALGLPLTYVIPR